MRIDKVKCRIYSDYFLPNRLEEYERLLVKTLEKEYTITSVIDYYDRIQNGCVDQSSKILICRHDVDTDPVTAKAFFDIEKRIGIRSSFYFRLSTLRPTLIQEIEDYGSEASYHFEEIASYCKRHRIRCQQVARSALPQIRDEFERNFLSIKEKVSVPMRSVASHGDFVNRFLKITNNELLTPDLRKRCGIEVEAYDPIVKQGSTNISDTGSPILWKPESIESVIKRGDKIINLLTHPRHWRSAPWINTKDNLLRIWEGLCFQL